MESPIAVIGGTGRVGRLVARSLLERGERVRVLGRSAHAAARPEEGLTHLRADVREAHTLTAPLADCSAVVYSVEPGTADSGPGSPRATMYQGMLNTLAALGTNAAHVVLVSQIYVTRKNHSMNAYGHLLDWRLAGEDALRAADLPHTVIRPSWLTDHRDAGTGVRLEQGDAGDGRISRADVAEAVVQALYAPQGAGITFEMYNEPGSAAPDWPRLFGALRRDEPAAVAR
ncbi:SDR family oxidoreductase [Kitasatospora sp. NBC_01250]|uniref:SDR family oxidoreductase n=1 Tax=unclassified Kitasatospora TaxID=2633591 RepID=UPI002E0F1813|nr:MULTISPECIES: SDR family oxidoreductase [unclassified Kitasatospora]WSJ67850.1 SDR family oxidoreductase [Kitasatospora sp. NBC_01302]